MRNTTRDTLKIVVIYLVFFALCFVAFRIYKNHSATSIQKNNQDIRNVVETQPDTIYSGDLSD